MQVIQLYKGCSVNTVNNSTVQYLVQYSTVPGTVQYSTWYSTAQSSSHGHILAPVDGPGRYGCMARLPLPEIRVHKYTLTHT